ncbi:unnamed protein product [Polarella glacialis]|uniref:Non-specific serine/threonine protein kinase n=1 Tax=Polarella glacialis TaxID=89957 RepID=A0A813DZN7_POLGL|nr:unnamed protein product [Polarella glacialis]
MKALLNHLYSRPVITTERELPVLRVAALSLGFSDLARSCEDIRPISRVVASRPGTPDAEPFSQVPATSSGASPEITSQLAVPIPHKLDRAASAPSAVTAARRGNNASTSAERLISGEISSETPDASDQCKMQYKVPSGLSGLPYTSDSYDSGEGRALPMAKPRGERSFTSDKATREATRSVAAGGSTSSTAAADRATSGPGAEREAGGREQKEGVRRILSEIKRSMAESSRIIADQTFQQCYEMVPGERGILGEGINGPVRMAIHRKTGREVAVKKISCLNLSEQRRQMLVSEVRIFLQVSHRNIVQLLEVYESEVDQAVLLVMELCTGKELFERLAERRWYSEFDAARVSRQMLDAVSYLHSQNICHRDLKLENWLYENPHPEAKLKLCDFGFGQIVEPHMKLTAALGSLFYVAPEVLEGSYGLPCDMWSVGVICYMLLSGVPPFDGKTDADVTAKIRQGRFASTGKRWEGLSETANHFVRSLLRKDPYERLTAAEASQHAWLKMESQPKTSWPKGSPDAELELPIDRGVIRDMWKFAQNNAITRAALGMLGKLNSTSGGGREEDVVLLDQRFKSYDENNTGKISAALFIQVLKETMNLQISTAEEKQFFERIAGTLPGTDAEQSGDAPTPAQNKGRRRREVNYREFIELTKARRMANNTAAIREAFRAFDERGDGYIREGDMHELLGDEFKTTIDNYVDVNGKDVIDYNRFANVVSMEMAMKDDQEKTEASNSRPDLQQASSSSIVEPSSNSATAAVDGKSAGAAAPAVSSPSASSAHSTVRNFVDVDVAELPESAADAGSRPAASPVSAGSAHCEARISSGSDPEEAEALVAASRPGWGVLVVRKESGNAPSAGSADEYAPSVGVASSQEESAALAKADEEKEKADGDRTDAQSEEEEDCDADAQSDEEQLVNVGSLDFGCPQP